MILTTFVFVSVLCAIRAQVLILYFESDDNNGVTCNFDETSYMRFYENLIQFTTLSVQYTCTKQDGLISDSAVVTNTSFSQPSDYLCLYDCIYLQPYITCTKKRKNDNLNFNPSNILLPFVSIDGLQPSDECITTRWTNFSLPFVWNSNVSLTLPVCDINCNDADQITETSTTQIVEGLTADTLTQSMVSDSGTSPGQTEDSPTTSSFNMVSVPTVNTNSTHVSRNELSTPDLHQPGIATTTKASTTATSDLHQIVPTTSINNINGSSIAPSKSDYHQKVTITTIITDSSTTAIPIQENHPTDTNTNIIFGVCLGAVALILVCVIVFLIVKHTINRRKTQTLDDVLPQQIEITHTSIPRQDIYDVIEYSEHRYDNVNFGTSDDYVI